MCYAISDTHFSLQSSIVSYRNKQVPYILFYKKKDQNALLSISLVSEHIDNVTDVEIKSHVLNSESRNKQSILKEHAIQKERIELAEKKSKDNHMQLIRSLGKQNSIYNKSTTSAKHVEVLCENGGDKKKDEIKFNDNKGKKFVGDNLYDKKKDEIKNEDKKMKKVVYDNLDDERNAEIKDNDNKMKKVVCDNLDDKRKKEFKNSDK